MAVLLHRFRAAAATVGVCAALVASGCGADKDPAADDQQSEQSTTQRSAPAPTLPKAVASADAADGICAKLSYEQIQTELGITVDVAALHSPGDSVQSCTFRSTGAPLPDLTLAFVPGKLDEKAFDERIKPENGAAVDGLGSSAYTVMRPANAESDPPTGPVCEVGWFTDSGSYTLVLTTPEQTSTQQAQTQLGKLVALGKSVR